MAHWNGVTDCEVPVVEPNQRLSYSWNASGEEAAKGIKTVVTWTPTPTQVGVLVRMEQSGFRPEDEAGYQGASYGWQRFVGGLERVLAGLIPELGAACLCRVPLAPWPKAAPRDKKTRPYDFKSIAIKTSAKSPA
jgi:hypothetical protein